MLNVAVAEIDLNLASVCALVGEGKAAGMAQRVGMDGHGSSRIAEAIKRARFTAEFDELQQILLRRSMKEFCHGQTH